MRLRIVSVLVVSVLSIGCENMPWNKAQDKEQPKAKVTPPPVSEGTGKSLYDRLGGEKAVRAVVDDFVARAAANPKVNFSRKGTPAEWQATDENVAMLKQRLVEFIGSATGGPQIYHGKDMVTSHQNMGITDAEFDAAAVDLKASLEKLKVAEKEAGELMTIVASTKGAIVQPAKAPAAK